MISIGGVEAVPWSKLNASGVVVHFARALSSADYVVLVTPVNRWCTPAVTNKTPQGFMILCSGIGGSVDFVVLPRR